jgi:hypothetical protein
MIASIFFILLWVCLVLAQPPARAPARFDLLVSDSQTLDWRFAQSSGDAMRVKAFHRPVENVDFTGKEIILRAGRTGWIAGEFGERKCAGSLLLASKGDPLVRTCEKRNGGERNQTFAAVIANHPFTNAFVEAFSQSFLRETMSDQPIAAPTHCSLAPLMPAVKT